jgi:hypothetical protein
MTVPELNKICIICDVMFGLCHYLQTCSDLTV